MRPFKKSGGTGRRAGGKRFIVPARAKQNLMAGSVLGSRQPPRVTLARAKVSRPDAPHRLESSSLEDDRPRRLCPRRSRQRQLLRIRSPPATMSSFASRALRFATAALCVVALAGGAVAQEDEPAATMAHLVVHKVRVAPRDPIRSDRSRHARPIAAPAARRSARPETRAAPDQPPFPRSPRAVRRRESARHRPEHDHQDRRVQRRRKVRARTAPPPTIRARSEHSRSIVRAPSLPRA